MPFNDDDTFDPTKKVEPATADGRHCIEIVKIAMADIKAQAKPHDRKPNPEFHELADALARFNANDAEGPLGEARRITRMSVFEGKKSWSVVRIRDLMGQMPENYSILVSGDEIIALVEQVIASTMVAKYVGPKFKLTVPHPQLGILRRRAYGEDTFDPKDV